MDDCKKYAIETISYVLENWDYQFEEVKYDSNPTYLSPDGYKHYCYVTDDLGLTFYITFKSEPPEKAFAKGRVEYKDNYIKVLRNYIKNNEKK